MTAAGFLGALQLADSSLPIGRFVHSGGLEPWLDANLDAGADELSELIATVLAESVGPLDATAVAFAHRGRALERLVELDALLTAHKPLAPGRVASQACGRQLAALALRLSGDELGGGFWRLVASARTDGNLAIVQGTLARALGVGLGQAVLIELRGAAAAMTSAAVRLGRLSALQAQVILRSLAPVIVQAQVDALGREAGELRAGTPELDVAALAHRRAEARLFAS